MNHLSFRSSLFGLSLFCSLLFESACRTHGATEDAHPAAAAGWQSGLPLKDWLILKPIRITSKDGPELDDAARKQAFAKDWLIAAGGEAGIQPHAGMRLQAAGGSVKWRRVESPNGVVDLLEAGRPSNDCIAYAWTEFDAPEKRAGYLGIGSDDSVKVWLNGKLVHENWTSRGVRVDEDIVPVDFERGTNRLLMKVQNGIGPWGLACRPLGIDEGEGLRLAALNKSESSRSPLTDADIKTILQDSIDGDKPAVGLVVGLVDEHGARVISHGKLSRDSDQDMDGDTLFQIGSITKLFTTLLLQDMVERGEMKLDDPVQKYLPDWVKMPERGGKPITLIHLATHTSGLPRERGISSPPEWRRPEVSHAIERLYFFLSNYELPRDPGSQVEYSNLGVGLLGHVIALKAGRDYEDLVIERICKPLGMDSTRIVLGPELLSRAAIGHVMPDIPVESFGSSTLPGAGALRSSANDLLKFVSANLGLTSSPLTSLMQKTHEVHRLDSGLELRLAWFGDGTTLNHGGLTDGFKTDLGFDMRKRRGQVVLCNWAHSRIAYLLPLRLADNQSPKPSRTVHVDPSSYDGYAGQYQTSEGGMYAVRREGDRLMMQWLGQPPRRYTHLPSFELFPQSPSVFYNQMWDIRVVFARSSKDGEAGFVLTNSQGAPNRAIRVSTELPQAFPPLKLDSAVYDAYAGQYRHAICFGLIHVGPILSISHTHNKLGDHLLARVPGRADIQNEEIYPESETWDPLESTCRHASLSIL